MPFTVFTKESGGYFTAALTTVVQGRGFNLISGHTTMLMTDHIWDKGVEYSHFNHATTWSALPVPSNRG